MPAPGRSAARAGARLGRRPAPRGPDAAGATARWRPFALLRWHFGPEWLTGGGQGRKVAQSGVKGRDLIAGFRALRGALWEQSPVARFFGRYEHSLDDKGRVILPSKFRAPFEHGGYLTEYQDGCLSLWTPDQFALQMESMLERAPTGRSDRNLVRLWASTSHELEIDRQGRMAIPSRLRAYAGLVGDVLVLGAIDRVELWNRETWDQKVLPEEERLTQGDDG